MQKQTILVETAGAIFGNFFPPKMVGDMLPYPELLKKTRFATLSLAWFYSRINILNEKAWVMLLFPVYQKIRTSSLFFLLGVLKNGTASIKADEPV